MKIRVNKFFFIFNLIILTLMLAGPVLAFCLTDSSNISYLMFIPIGMIVLFFSLNFLIYFLSPFVVNEEGFYKYTFGKKTTKIKKETITQVIAAYNDINTKKTVVMVIVMYKDNLDRLFQTQLSGNLYNLKGLAEAFKKYNYPVIEQ